MQLLENRSHQYCIAIWDHSLLQGLIVTFNDRNYAISKDYYDYSKIVETNSLLARESVILALDLDHSPRNSKLFADTNMMTVIGGFYFSIYMVI